MSLILLESLRVWWPECLLSAGALLVIIVGVWFRRRHLTDGVAWASLVAGAWALWKTPAAPATGAFFGLILCDPFSLAFRWLALGVTALVLLMVMGSRETTRHHGEYLGLLLLLAVGLMVMAEANHLLMAYVAMELVSLSGYLLVGFLEEPRSAEAALKYLLFGALSSAVMLFGMSLLVGVTGQMAFPDIRFASAGLDGGHTSALLAAVTLMLVGLAFKISMVPFHMWTPDAYEGAPMAVAALLSVGPKAAGFALLLRLLEAFRPAWPQLVPLVLGLTVMTMTLGNLVALVQTNVKRLLAYSTIAQVGYLLIGVTSDSRLGLEALLVYLVAYLFMNLGAFACAAAVADETGSESLEAFKGLAARSPGLALACALFLLSLAGIPPLFGFLGKFLLFGSALEAGRMWLAVAGVVNSAIALYYYVNLIRLMYFVGPPHRAPLHVAPALRVALVVCAAATLGLGLFPSAVLVLVGGASTVQLF